MQAEEVKMSSKLAAKKADVEKMEKAQATEVKNKAMLAQDQKKAEAAAAAAAVDQKKATQANMQERAATKAYSDSWLKAKEVNAEKRNANDEAVACRVKQDQSLKALQRTQKHQNELRSKLKTLSDSLSAAESVNDEAKAESIRSQVKQAKEKVGALKLAVSEADVNHKRLEADCRQKAQMLNTLKNEAKKEALKTETAKQETKAATSKVKATSTAAKEMSSAAKRNEKGFESWARKAVSVPQSLQIVSASHYCAMK